MAAVRAVLPIPLTVGGGVRTLDDATALLRAGADKVGINTAAFENPQLLTDIAEQLGRQCTVVSVDAARRTDGDGWEVVTRSGTHRTGRDALDWAEEAVARGAGEILLTSWDRDGTRLGYDTELLAAVTARCPRTGDRFGRRLRKHVTCSRPSRPARAPSWLRPSSTRTNGPSRR